MRYVLWLLTILLSGLTLTQPARAFEVRFHQGLGGVVSRVTVGADDSLIELARSYDIGYNEIVAANPGVDPFIPTEGTEVIIPSAWLLPDVPKREGIVINLAEMRLYLFPSRKSNSVETFPLGIGDEGWDTPTGTYRITEKTKNPAWYVPPSIRAYKPDLPKIVPAGPDNPLGTHALRLSHGTVLIHGTNRPFGIGRRVSHGCVHLYPEDIEVLFRKVKLGVMVTIIRQQVKATLADGRVLVEVHVNGDENLEQEALTLLEKKGLLAKVDLDALKAAVLDGLGVPTDVTRK
jgi:L,D-transpeptidase ErfK/SrfK